MKRDIKDYEDIINVSWPRESLRAKMPVKDRAKIFLPFAALKGYEESLESVRQIVDDDSSFSQNSDLENDFLL